MTVYQELDYCAQYQQEQSLCCFHTVSKKLYFIYGILTAVA